MKKPFLIFLSGALILASAYAQEVYFSGDLGTMWGVYAPGTVNAGDFSTGVTGFTGQIEAYEGDGTAFIEAHADYDSVTKEYSFDISEAYMDYSSADWGIRIGQQKTAWGKADGINITNSVFPGDSSTLYSDDTVAVKAARFSYTGSSFTVDAFIIPFFTGTRLPLEENNPLRKAIVPESVAFNNGGISMTLPVNVGTLSEPRMNLEDMEYGIKASGYFSYCDVSVYGFYGWDKTPILNYKINTALNAVYNVEMPESITINGEYKRLAMVGLDFAVPVGPVVLRAETAFFPDREIQASTKAIMEGKGSSIRQNQLMALAGIDWMPEGWTVTAQYYCDALPNRSDDVERTDAYEHGATVSISKSFLDDTLDVSASGMVSFNAFDSVMNGTLKYSLSDQIALSASGYLFLPGISEDGDYGRLKDFSSICVKAEYRW